jgi:hypothetical protein
VDRTIVAEQPGDAGQRRRREQRAAGLDGGREAIGREADLRGQRGIGVDHRDDLRGRRAGDRHVALLGEVLALPHRHSTGRERQHRDQDQHGGDRPSPTDAPARSGVARREELLFHMAE